MEILYPFLENFTNGVVIHDADTHVIFANSAALEFLGLTMDQITGKVATDPHWKFIREDESPMPLEEYPVNHVLSCKEVLKNMVLGIVRSDRDKPLWCVCNGHPICNTEGKVSKIIINFTDITETKETKEKLRKANEFSRNVISSMQDGFSLLDPNGVSIDVNPAFCQMVGFSRDELIGRSIPHPYWPPEEYRKIYDAFERTVQDKNESFELTFMRKNGERFPTIVSPSSIRENGIITYFMATVKDISDRKRNENKLQHAINSRDEFISIMSHELKTPLTSIKLLAQMTSKDVNKEDDGICSASKIKSVLEKIDINTNRMTRLVDDMLDSGRMRTGKFQIKPEKFDLKDLASEVIERLRPSMKMVKTPPTFECNEALLGYWDKDRIEQVLTNLLTNAMKYGNSRPVEIRLKKEDHFVLLSVRDQGLGIAKEDLTRIFLRFERAIPANEISGLGLGLFIAEEIVKAHEGEIWVESEGIGKGAIFFVKLPI